MRNAITLSPKIKSFLMFFIVHAFILAIVFVALNSVTSVDYNSFVKLCWVANIVFLIELIILRFKFKTLIHHTVLFDIVLFLFTFGQCILYSFNVEPSTFSIIEYVSIESLVKALKFAIPAYICFVFGSIIGSKEKVFQKSSDITPNAKKWAYVFMFIGLVPFVATMVNNISIVASSGYNYFYEEGVRISNVITFFSYYFYVGLFLLSISNEKNIRITSFIILFGVTLVYFLCGDRGTAISLLLSVFFLFVYNRSGATKKKKHLLLLIIVLIVSMSSVSIISDWRSSNFSSSFFSVALKSLKTNNIFTSTLSNLGGTMYALAKTIDLVPSDSSFIYGGSYFASLVLLVPSFFRVGFLGVIDSTPIYSSPASWLVNTLNLSYGAGYTPFAESYLNFGLAGIPFMILLGWFFGKIFTISYGKKNNIVYPMQIFAFFLLVMSARGSFNYVFAFWIRYLLIPVFCISFIGFENSSYNGKKAFICNR